jgi:hypothetical protein
LVPLEEPMHQKTGMLLHFEGVDQTDTRLVPYSQVCGEDGDGENYLEQRLIKLESPEVL